MGGFRRSARRDEQIADPLFGSEDLRHPGEDMLVKQARLAADIMRQVGLKKESEAIRLRHPGQPVAFRSGVGGEGLDREFDEAGEFVTLLLDPLLEIFGAEFLLEAGLRAFHCSTSKVQPLATTSSA